jgi:hypothetical protein
MWVGDGAVTQPTASTPVPAAIMMAAATAIACVLLLLLCAKKKARPTEQRRNKDHSATNPNVVWEDPKPDPKPAGSDKTKTTTTPDKAAPIKAAKKPTAGSNGSIKGDKTAEKSAATAQPHGGKQPSQRCVSKHVHIPGVHLLTSTLASSSLLPTPVV